MRGRRNVWAPRTPRASRLRPARPRSEPARESPLGADPPRTLREGIRAAEALLDAAGVEEAVADARLILALALGASPTWVFTHEGDPMPEAAWERFRGLVARRCAREPLQHLRGEQEFFGLRFRVGPQALLPRPETELLVERLIEHLRHVDAPRLADIGTGSGCIAVAAATEIPRSRVVATDVSEDALALARRNAAEHGVESRIVFAQGPLGEPLREHAPLHAIAANLPYVTTAEMQDLQPEVRDFEPRLALDGGSDGLDLVRGLVAQAPGLLAPGGWLVLEVGHEQAAVTAGLLRQAGLQDVAIHRDLAGIGRVVEGRRP